VEKEFFNRIDPKPGGLDDATRIAEARERIERGERWLLERDRDAQRLASLGHLCGQAEALGQGAQLPGSEPVVRGKSLGAP